jgi:hypothetical protein
MPRRAAAMSGATGALRLRARMAALDALRQPGSNARARTAQAMVTAAFDAAWESARPAVEAAGSLACAAGCASCCHQHVAVAAIEAVAIADALAAAPAPDLRVRTLAAASRMRGMDALARRHARVPCPFLAADGACGIYPVRPLRCRGLHGRDAALCRAQTEDPVAAADQRRTRTGAPAAFPILPVRLADAALAGLVEAGAAHGIASATLELTRAVALLLGAPERAEAAMRGQDDLAEARLETDRAGMAAP